MVKQYLALGALISILAHGGKAGAESLDEKAIGPVMHDLAEKMQGCVQPIPMTSESLYPKSFGAYRTNGSGNGRKIEFAWFDGNEQTPSDGRIGPGDSLELTTKGPGDFATYLVIKIGPDGQYKIKGYILPQTDEANKYLDTIRKNIESKCIPAC